MKRGMGSEKWEDKVLLSRRERDIRWSRVAPRAEKPSQSDLIPIPTTHSLLQANVHLIAPLCYVHILCLDYVTLEAGRDGY